MFSHGNTLPATENHQQGVSGGWARLWRAGDPSASPQKKKPWVCVKQPSKQWPRQLRTAGDGNATCSIWPLHQAHRNKYKCFDLRRWYQMKVKHLLLLRLGEKLSWRRKKRSQWRKGQEEAGFKVQLRHSRPWEGDWTAVTVRCALGPTSNCSYGSWVSEHQTNKGF